MGCNNTKEFRIINLYDLADIKLNKNTIQIGDLYIDYFLIKKIKKEYDNIIIIVEIDSYDKYIFVFQNKQNLFNNLFNKLVKIKDNYELS